MADVDINEQLRIAGMFDPPNVADQAKVEQVSALCAQMALALASVLDPTVRDAKYLSPYWDVIYKVGELHTACLTALNVEANPSYTGEPAP